MQAQPCSPGTATARLAEGEGVAWGKLCLTVLQNLSLSGARVSRKSVGRSGERREGECEEDVAMKKKEFRNVLG